MAATKKQLAKIASGAPFVFVGKVGKLGAATMDGLAAKNTAIVNVERVVTAPEMFHGITGQDVTVRMPKGASLRKNDRKTFFADGWIFGASLAVDVRAVTDVTDTAVTAPMVRAAATAQADATLKERIDAAALGVVGTVTNVERSPVETSHVSEHDPDWHEATIDVDEVIKGKKGTKRVTVLFPNSDDMRWHHVDKYSVGEQGIFMLQRKAKASAAGVSPKLLAAVPDQPDTFTTLHPADHLPLDQLERVRALARK